MSLVKAGRRDKVRAAVSRAWVDSLERRVLFAVDVTTGSVPWAAESLAPSTSSTTMTAAAATTAPTVTGLVLINADTDQAVGPLATGTAVDFGVIGTKNLNIRADTNPSNVGSVRFSLDSNPNFRTENTAVYAFAGNNGNDYLAWTPTVGTHTVTATAYTGVNATGTASAVYSVTFTVSNSTSTTPVVSIVASDTTASEPGTDKGSFVVTRTGATTNPMTVNIAVTGTAAKGTDYTSLGTSVVIPAGQSSAALTVSPIDDTAAEPSESVIVTLSSGTGYTVSSTSKSATVTILDNDSGTTDPGQTPFLGSPFVLPTTIQTEDFDDGGQGIAYSDADPSNVSGSYRSNVGVDIEPTTDAGGGYNIGHVVAGEWLEYTVNVPTAGGYDAGIRFATASGGGTASIWVDGVNVSGSITLPYTGDWQSWTTVKKAGLNLPGGQHVIRLSIDSSAWGGDVGNINWIQFTPTPPPATPPAWPTSWTAAKAAPSPRFESCDITFNNKIYVFGGFKNSNFQVDRTYVNYDPATNTWTSLGTLPVGMAETHLGVSTDGTYIYFAGGFGGDLNSNVSPTQWISDKVWRFDPAANTWSQIATLPEARGAGALDYVGRELHYLGGNPGDRVTNLPTHYVYNLDTGLWRTAAALPNAKDHASSVVLNGKIYYMGGEHGHDQLHLQMNDAHVYDPATDAWTQIADMPLAKSHTEGGTFVSDGKIVWAGGQIDNFQPTTNVIAYDPVANAWATLSPIPVALQGEVCQRIGNKIILTLGGQQTYQPQSATWIGTLPLA